jgi:hypothetical protein
MSYEILEEYIQQYIEGNEVLRSLLCGMGEPLWQVLNSIGKLLSFKNILW